MTIRGVFVLSGRRGDLVSSWNHRQGRGVIKVAMKDRLLDPAVHNARQEPLVGGRKIIDPALYQNIMWHIKFHSIISLAYKYSRRSTVL